MSFTKTRTRTIAVELGIPDNFQKCIVALGWNEAMDVVLHGDKYAVSQPNLEEAFAEIATKDAAHTLVLNDEIRPKFARLIYTAAQACPQSPECPLPVQQGHWIRHAQSGRREGGRARRVQGQVFELLQAEPFVRLVISA